MSILFPAVRPADPVVEAFAQQVALALDPRDDDLPETFVDEALELLGDDERQRIVQSWADRYPDRWASLSRAIGDDRLLERAFVASAVRGAIVERRPPPRECVEILESGMFGGAPCSALTLVVAPVLVWSREDALGVATAIAHHGDEAGRFAALPKITEAWVRDEHTERLARCAGRVEALLPFAGLPRASQTLSDGCRLVQEDASLAGAVAAVLLATYALSARSYTC